MNVDILPYASKNRYRNRYRFRQFKKLEKRELEIKFEDICKANMFYFRSEREKEVMSLT